jgi:BRCT domain type II-containing protein
VRELCEATANQSTSFAISTTFASSSNLSSKLLPRLTRRVQLPVANVALLELQKQKMSMPASDRPDAALVRPSSFARVLYPEQADQVTAVIQSALEIAKHCTKSESGLLWIDMVVL